MRISDWSSDVCSSDLAVAQMVVALVDEPPGSAHLECRSHEAPAGDLGVRDSELVSFGVPAAGALGPALGVGEAVAHGDEVRLELVHNSSSTASSSAMPVHSRPDRKTSGAGNSGAGR